MIKKYSIRKVAKTLNRSASGICDEININQVNGEYDAKKAQHKAYVRRKYSKYQGMKIIKNKPLRSFVEKNLYDGQSPCNISGRIKKHEKNLTVVSKNSIYKYIKSPHGRNIESFRNKLRDRKRRKGRVSLKKLSDREFIDKRLKIIENRGRIGDMEADFIVSGKSGKGILLVVVCRKSRVVFIEQILIVSIKNVHKAFLKIKKRFPEMKTITTDNDILFRFHKELARLLLVKMYFCHPYHSWEKGSVENANKFIRKYVLKRSDISKYSKKFIKSVEERANRRFMKCLNYSSPYEIINDYRLRINKKTLKAF